LYTRNLGGLCIQHGVFRVGLLNDVTQILPRPSLVAMFETKWAITDLVWEISRRCLRLVRVFLDRAIKWRQSNSATIDLGCHGNERHNW